MIFLATKYLEEHLGVDVDHVVTGAEDVDEWVGAIFGEPVENVPLVTIRHIRLLILISPCWSTG